MQFISKIFEVLTPKIKKYEAEATDVLELPNDLKAIRSQGKIIVVAKNKIVNEFKDTFSSNPARAAFHIMKKLNIASYKNYSEAMKKLSEKEIWTCGFRENEDRWVWYKNSEPQMTVSFKEIHPNEDLTKTDDLEKKIDFCSAKYGTTIIEEIKKSGLKETANKINALILEKPYTEIECKKCNTKENYTIDDLVDENKNAKYDSNYIVCSNCNELIKLV